MSANELTAAGITDPTLRLAYTVCRDLNKKHGKTYYLATLLLPPEKRPYVHALYGFARYADEIVDTYDESEPVEIRSAKFAAWSADFLRALETRQSDDLVIRAVIDTITRWNIPTDHFAAFLHSMQMDLTVTEYENFDDLMEYVYGSASVIGLQMMPILEPTDESAYEAAQQLGVAFQLANFIRDVNEDLDRGRIYLPLAELRQFGVSRADLEKRLLTPKIVDALKFQIARVRDLEEKSRSGIASLSPSTQPCIDTARILYCGIVGAVENINYDIFNKRASVPLLKRLSVALPAWYRARKLWK